MCATVIDHIQSVIAPFLLRNDLCCVCVLICVMACVEECVCVDHLLCCRLCVCVYVLCRFVATLIHVLVLKTVSEHVDINCDSSRAV